MRLEGIHHITAITGDAPGNLDFYTRVLGMRMAAKTVNQDDPSAYHLFYADENGRPGSEMTFFEYPGSPRGRAGSGMVHRIVSRVDSEAALDFWGARIGDEGLQAERLDGAVRFADPEGLGHELVVSDANPPLKAVHPEIPDEVAIGGFVAVRAYSRRPEESGALLQQVMGAVPVGERAYELRGEHRGGLITLDEAPEERPLQGAGTVHHVAWGTTMAEHPDWAVHLRRAGVNSTQVIDRHYFHSIYFREPSGVLYEIADDGPGFTRDLPMEELGSKVILPPWLEPQRDEVVAGLTPLPDPRATWPAVSA